MDEVLFELQMYYDKKEAEEAEYEYANQLAKSRSLANKRKK